MGELIKQFELFKPYRKTLEAKIREKWASLT